MKKEIVLTPEWVFTKTGTSCWADGEGNAKISSQSSGIAKLIRLTLDSLEISYKEDYFTDGYSNWYHRFIFRIDELMDDCPVLYRHLEVIDQKLKN